LVFPIRVYGRGICSGLLVPCEDFGIWVDLGAYGVPRAVKQGKAFDTKAQARGMKHWTREKGGSQATNTDLFCTSRRNFRQMFNHDLYYEQRANYKCLDVFPEVYGKIEPQKGIVDLTEILNQERKASLKKREHTHA
jgi:delta24-sterol reductase